MGPTLSVRIKKRPDSKAMLILSRADGTSTRGSIGAPSGYGPVHDLAHLVVERALELSDGFLGLVASGWEISDFEVKGVSVKLPPDALLAEVLAGQISAEEMMQQFSSAEDFDASIRAYFADRGPAGYAPPFIPEEILTAMRVELADLRRQWELLPPGDSLELAFMAQREASVERPL